MRSALQIKSEMLIWVVGIFNIKEYQILIKKDMKKYLIF